jgi:TolB-like protein/tetratricopeptide (TPR) repeat protein
LRVERTPASRRPAPPVGAPARAPQPPRRLTFALLLSAAALIMVAGYFAFERHARLPVPVISAAQPAFVPPPHSVAVLPFANLSGDANQEYLSDGLSEELLNALTRIDGLQVAARTSSFSFKGTNVDIATIARRLNVGAVLEGSLRRSGRKVRVTAQLINAVTGFHIWSQTYDEDLTDALIVQTSVATAVAHELDVALSGNPLSKIGQGGTRSAEALDAYLRGAHVMGRAHNTEDMRLAIADFDEAIKFDRKYAAAYAVRASAFTNICAGTFDLKLLPDLRTQAKQSAEAAVALAPDFPLALIVRGFVRAVALLDFGSAGPDFERAIQLSPGSALAQKGFALYSSIVGHPQAAIAASRRAVELDPENYSARNNFVITLLAARRYTDALQAIADWKASDPRVEPSEWLGPIYLATGRPDLALKICDNTLDGPSPEFRCLAMAHHALGHHPQAESVLRRMQQKYGDSHAFGYAEIYAQWGNVAEAIRWLRVAAQLRVSELQALRSSWALDPVRGESAYHEIEREFNFPPN